MELGEIYRRAELVEYSRCLDRDLRVLVEAGEVRRLWRGVYCRPEMCPIGQVPPDHIKVVRALLRDDSFIVTSLNMYNAMQVGTTQLYNVWLVYNHKRSGRIKVCGQNYRFIRGRCFPGKPTLAFCYVDLINNLEMLAEDRDAVRTQAVKKIFELGIDEVCREARAYGTAATKRFIERICRDGAPEDSKFADTHARHLNGCSRESDARARGTGFNAVDTQARAQGMGDLADTRAPAQRSDAHSRKLDVSSRQSDAHTHAHAQRSDTRSGRPDAHFRQPDAHIHAHAQRSDAHSRRPDIPSRRSDAHSQQSGAHARLSDEPTTGVNNALPSPETDNRPAETDNDPANTSGASLGRQGSENQ